MSDRMYSLTQAAWYLRVTTKTLNTWLEQIHVAPAVIPGTKRSARWVSRDAVNQLAQRKNIVLQPSFWGEADDLNGRAQINANIHPIETVFMGDRVDYQQQASLTHLAPRGTSIDEAVRRVIAYIDGAPPVLWPGGSDLIITAHGRYNPFLLASEALQKEWLDALGRAYTRQHRRIVHLIQLDDDPARTARMVKFLIPAFSHIGALYHPIYTQYSDSPSREYILVPERGLLALALTEGQTLECTIEEFDQESDLYMQLKGSVAKWMQDASPLVTRYPAGESYRFHRAIARLEAESGDRCLVMNGLSDLTVPSAIQFARAQALEAQFAREPLNQARRSRMSHDAPMGIYREHVNREDAFHSVVPDYQVRDICPLQVVRHYSHTGRYCPHDWFAHEGCRALEPNDRRQHLQHLINRLKTWPNYHLALIDSNDHIDPAIYRTFWLVKQGRGVLIEAVSLNAQGQREALNLEINERHIVEAFYAYSLDLWNGIRKHRKGETWVTHTLTDLMGGIE